MKIVKMAPKKQPRLYAATEIPWFKLRCDLTAPDIPFSFGSMSGKYLVKDGKSKKPPVIPWSYPKSLFSLIVSYKRIFGKCEVKGPLHVQEIKTAE